ncbi:MAG: ABC transporter substrate-binding protein [Burkholderiales bacterium]
MLSRKIISTLLTLCIALGCEVAAAMPEKPKVIFAVGGKATLYYLPLTIAEKSGDIRIVVETISDKGTRNVFGGTIPAATLYSRKDFIDRHPNTVQALTNAMVRALRWLQTATPEDIAEVVPQEYLLGDRELYLAALERLKPTYSRDGLIPAKGVDNSYDVLRAHNSAVRRAPVIWLKDTYTNRFVENALKTPQ